LTILLRQFIRLYSLPVLLAICPHESEARARILCARLVRCKRFVDKALDIHIACRPWLRIRARLRTDKPAAHALLGRPSSAKWRVLYADLVAMLISQGRRESDGVRVLDISIAPILCRR